MGWSRTVQTIAKQRVRRGHRVKITTRGVQPPSRKPVTESRLLNRWINMDVIGDNRYFFCLSMLESSIAKLP